MTFRSGEGLAAPLNQFVDQLLQHVRIVDAQQFFGLPPITRDGEAAIDSVFALPLFAWDGSAAESAPSPCPVQSGNAMGRAIQFAAVHAPGMRAGELPFLPCQTQQAEVARVRREVIAVAQTTAISAIGMSDDVKILAAQTICQRMPEWQEHVMQRGAPSA